MGWNLLTPKKLPLCSINCWVSTLQSVCVFTGLQLPVRNIAPDVDSSYREKKRLSKRWVFILLFNIYTCTIKWIYRWSHGTLYLWAYTVLIWLSVTQGNVPSCYKHTNALSVVELIQMFDDYTVLCLSYCHTIWCHKLVFMSNDQFQ